MNNRKDIDNIDGEYSKGADMLLNSGFYNAFIEVHGSIDVTQFESLCGIITKVGKEVARFVNYIEIRKNALVLILDPVFEMKLVPQFNGEGDWSYYIDVLNLVKGYYKKIKGYPTFYIVKPVIWSREAKA
jgi:hypothetical protein